MPIVSVRPLSLVPKFPSEISEAVLYHPDKVVR
jgi:hypothetical protein